MTCQHATPYLIALEETCVEFGDETLWYADAVET